MELINAVAVVTGGAHGIGRALCRALNEAGARVAVADLDFAAARSVAAEVGGLALQLDVANEQELIDGVRQVEQQAAEARAVLAKEAEALAENISNNILKS